MEKKGDIIYYEIMGNRFLHHMVRYIVGSMVAVNDNKLSKSDFIYHAGTKINNGELKSTGGRVLNVTSIGNNFLKIRNKIILIIKKINWKKGFYRKDIGWKVIDKNESR